MLKSIPLPVQVDMVLEDLTDELCGLTAGTVFLHIQNNKVFTYGVRHRLENRLEQGKDGKYGRPAVSRDHILLFREMAADIASRKSNWDRGTVSYKFSVKQGTLQVSADFAEMDDFMME